MPNHIHLCLETKETPLSNIMQGLQESYALYHHKKYKMVGHLYQGPYNAILCDREDYLLNRVAYFHLNPCRGRLVKAPEDYIWSSHNDYKGSHMYPFVKKKFVLDYFAANQTEARKKYMLFIQSRIQGYDWKTLFEVIDQRFYGSKEFIEFVKEECLNKKHFPTDVSYETHKKAFKRITLNEILKIISKESKVSSECILGQSREKRIADARCVFAYLASRFSGYKNKEIAEYLRKESCSISHMIKKVEEISSQEDKLLILISNTKKVMKVMNVRPRNEN